MIIKDVNKNQSVVFLQNEQKKSNTKNVLLPLGGSLLLGSMVALAMYNKYGVVKKTSVNLKEFLKLCQSAKPENYVASKENIQNKIFKLDLHSHSNHSDGWGEVSEILNQVVAYADELHNKTGEKFTFALTDHDTVSGVKEAIEIIERNPKKFKNLNFVPGVELSFLFNSNGQVKSGELLAYCIDPSSKTMQTLVENLNINRAKMIDRCFEKLGVGFARADLHNYFLNKDGETFAYNLHYRLRNYAQIKNRINKMAKIQNVNAEKLYKELMDGYVFSNGARVQKPLVSPEGFNNYLISRHIHNDIPMIDNHIDTILDEFFPKIVNNYIVSNTENSFEMIIDTLKEDKNVVLGFAHPYYTAAQMTDYKKEFSELIKYANGKIKLSENYHQAYASKISKSKINEINDYLLGEKLIPIGGRDNHGSSFWN